MNLRRASALRGRPGWGGRPGNFVNLTRTPALAECASVASAPPRRGPTARRRCGRAGTAVHCGVDHRRYYVIGAATGEHGPYSLKELAEAAQRGEVSALDQVRTALGTRVGTVGTVLRGSDARERATSDDLGRRRRTRQPPVVVLVIAAILVAIALMLIALRPGNASGGPTAAPPQTSPVAEGSTPPPPTSAPRPASSAPPAPAPAPTAPDASAQALTSDDPFAGSAAHYALRRVVPGYQGPLVRIHRHSDGAELDVGAQADDTLDANALVTFCRGASISSVARWYDQGTAYADLRQAEQARQPHLYSKGQLMLVNQRPSMHFKRPERWLDSAAAVGVGTVLVVLTCDEKERFVEFQTVLALAGTGDHAFLRGTSGSDRFDAMAGKVADLRIDGVPGFACPQFTRLKVVDALLAQAADAAPLRLGNDAGWTALRGWNGFVSELVIFTAALQSARRRAAEEALARHFAITMSTR